MKIIFSGSFEHPVIFLNDPSGGTVPSDVSIAPVTATSTCIAVTVQHYVDGPAELILSSDRPMPPWLTAFRGRIQVPGRAVTLSDSTGFNYIQVPVKSDIAEIQIAFRDDRHEVPWITIDNIDEF